MRLIDADKVKENIEEWLGCVGSVFIGKGLSYTWELEGCIDDAPTIEAEPVVRCKDCKHCLIDNKRNDGLCMRIVYRERKRLNDFCSYGERKDNESLRRI